MKTVLFGFDSAWSSTNKGAIAGASVDGDQKCELILSPTTADFPHAKQLIDSLRADARQAIIFVDQPHIVVNESGSRPVEDIVSSLVGRRYGGMQRSATHEPAVRLPMFGPEAPIWEFCRHFGGPSDPFNALDSSVILLETYPVLYLIANDWVLSDKRSTGRLPKYNPARRKTFVAEDWCFLCRHLTEQSERFQIAELSEWLREAERAEKPNKVLQDKLDAAICLVQAIEWHLSSEFLVVGDFATGYIVTKANDKLKAGLTERCDQLQKRNPGENWRSDYWINTVKRRL
ncbi:DUF429 domain-containing protein [Aporhodopirellula aestuarii]|uniref:DUF429 domain-containing protein n=1 Tax=Aporhodopirellula aestuarii TaxID=2950107 RepID=A0ABT0UE81_9BACT|nr:DUF429 domain-containing protein [Aporhodopirellula aestuarii]MCM2374678.1 DUF429 domain-containing protein [Aporhodopirellula aestuarii]